ncbi:protein zer-1 homolog [Ylistrum balloti]|uniref:protein zer-1 homolog n=1 Tax=Ylistrum balloti TaxID=509963 RepID=UPI002905A396|nr:protein zer-1 homolog [Ylistrum balloti]
MSNPSSTKIDPLLHMCVRYCANNIDTLTRSAVRNSKDEGDTDFCTNFSGMPSFPMNLSNMLFIYIERYLGTKNKAKFIKLLSLFGDPNKTPLRRMFLQQEHTLCGSLPPSVFDQPIQYLDLCYCQFCNDLNNTKSDSFPAFHKLCNSLKVIRISFSPNCRLEHDEDSTNILSGVNEEFNQPEKDTVVTDAAKVDEYNVTALGYLRFPALTHYTLNVHTESSMQAETVISFTKCFFKVTGTTFNRLTHLNLFGLGLTENDLDFLEDIPTLTSLGLSGHQIKDVVTGLGQIAKAENLRHLDISAIVEEPRMYEAPEESMNELLNSLPSLTSLDISGTNLAGVKMENKQKDQAKQQWVEKTISQSFGYRKFSFLGLCNCSELPFSWENVPAEEFTCLAKFENVVLAMEVYKNNTGMLQPVIHALQWFINSSMSDQQINKIKLTIDTNTIVLIECLLKVIHLHPNIDTIQRDSCACIALLLIRDSPSMKDTAISLGQSLRAKILETTLFCLNNSSNHVTLSCCLRILLKLKLPHDAKYCYSMKRYMKCVMEKFCSSDNHSYVSQTLETYAIHLMRIAIYYGDYESRDFLGQQGFIEFLLSVARRKTSHCTHLAWQCLWGLTDEVPSNCMRLLAVPDALELYLECLKGKQQGDSFVRGLLGVMANVSEVAELRKELLQNEELLIIISDLTDSQVMEEALSFQATCLMANLVSDGPDAWILKNPDRSSVLAKISAAVHRWDISSSMKTLYRSLLPFLEMAQKSHTPEAQLLAIWCICNLIKSKGSVYCQMLKMEGGLPVMETIRNDPETTQEVQELAAMAIDLVSSKDIPESDDTVKSALEIAASSS